MTILLEPEARSISHTDHDRRGIGSAIGLRALAALLEETAASDQSTARERTLHAYARLGELVAAGHLDEYPARGMIHAAARRAGLTPDEIAEVEMGARVAAT